MRTAAVLPVHDAACLAAYVTQRPAEDSIVSMFNPRPAAAHTPRCGPSACSQLRCLCLAAACLAAPCCEALQPIQRTASRPVCIPCPNASQHSQVPAYAGQHSLLLCWLDSRPPTLCAFKARTQIGLAQCACQQLKHCAAQAGPSQRDAFSQPQAPAYSSTGFGGPQQGAYGAQQGQQPGSLYPQLGGPGPSSSSGQQVRCQADAYQLVVQVSASSS